MSGPPPRRQRPFGFYGILRIHRFALGHEISQEAESRSDIIDGAMATYYCNDCWKTGSLITLANPLNLLNTPYHRDQFAKHSTPSSPCQMNSVFRDPSAYEFLVQSTLEEGFLEVDYWGRKNVYWFTASHLGDEYRNCVFAASESGMRVLFPEFQPQIHGHPMAASPARSATCASCGSTIRFSF